MTNVADMSDGVLRQSYRRLTRTLSAGNINEKDLPALTERKEEILKEIKRRKLSR